MKNWVETLNKYKTLKKEKMMKIEEEKKKIYRESENLKNKFNQLLQEHKMLKHQNEALALQLSEKNKIVLHIEEKLKEFSNKETQNLHFNELNSIFSSLKEQQQKIEMMEQNQKTEIENLKNDLSENKNSNLLLTEEKINQIKSELEKKNQENQILIGKLNETRKVLDETQEERDLLIESNRNGEEQIKQFFEYKINCDNQILELKMKLQQNTEKTNSTLKNYNVLQNNFNLLEEKFDFVQKENHRLSDDLKNTQQVLLMLKETHEKMIEDFKSYDKQISSSKIVPLNKPLSSFNKKELESIIVNLRNASHATQKHVGIMFTKIEQLEKERDIRFDIERQRSEILYNELELIKESTRKFRTDFFMKAGINEEILSKFEKVLFIIFFFFFFTFLFFVFFFLIFSFFFFLFFLFLIYNF